jgi:hypothetical protein
VPAVRPVIAIVPLPACEIVPVIPPGDEVAVYEVIAAPPFEVGAMNETFTVVKPVDAATTEVGALGAVMQPVIDLLPSPAAARSKRVNDVPQY